MGIEILINMLEKLIKPIVVELGYELYYLEFVKEGGDNYLRIYIENSNGISLDDCEKVSRAVSTMLDTQDPIEQSYYLEVSSPGIDRILYNDEHLKRYTGSKVVAKLNSLFMGNKKIEGKLLDFDEKELRIQKDEEKISVPREIISCVNLIGEL